MADPLAPIRHRLSDEADRNALFEAVCPPAPSGALVALIVELVGPQGDAGSMRVEPEMVLAFAKYLGQNGAQIDVVCAPGVLEEEDTFKATVESLSAHGVSVVAAHSSQFVKVGGEHIRSAVVLDAVARADLRVLMTRAVRHRLMGLGGALLGVAQCLPPEAREQLFRRAVTREHLRSCLEELAERLGIDGFLLDMSNFDAVALSGVDAVQMDEVAHELIQGLKVRDARQVLPPEQGHYPGVDRSLCTSCGSCVSLCPTEAVTLPKADEAVSFDRSACMRCGICIAACPDFAITESVNPLAVRSRSGEAFDLTGQGIAPWDGNRVPIAAAMTLGPDAIEAAPRQPAWLDGYTPPDRYALARSRERNPEPFIPRTVLPADGRVRLVIPPNWGIRGNRSALGIAYLAGALGAEGFDPYVVDLAYEMRIHDPALHEALEVYGNPDPNGGLYGPRIPLLLQVVDPKAFGDDCPEMASQVAAAAKADAGRLGDPGALFGLTVADSSVTYAFALGAALKRIGCRVVFGGPTMSHQPTAELALRIGAADAVVLGEGEAAMIALAKAHRDGTWETLGEEPVPGLARWHNEKFVLTPNARNRALDALAFPDWRGQRHPPDFVPILAARGCVTKCSFCSEQTISPKFAQRSVQDVLAEMDILNRDFGATVFEFNDDLLNGNMKWLRAFCEALIERGTPYQWQGLCRPHKLNKADLTLMRDAGCIQISYGVQHFSWRMLQIMGRREAPDPIREILRDTLELGMQSYVDIILGHPGETEEDVEITIASVRELMSTFGNIAVNLNPYNHIYGSATDVWPERYGVTIERFSDTLPEPFAHVQSLAERYVVQAHQTPDPETVIDRVNRLAWVVFQARMPRKIPILNEELPFCNDNCLHCGVADIMKTANVVPYASIANSLRQLAPRSGGTVMFAVSELTIRPDFFKIMRAGRASGMRTIALVTNGRMFAYPEFTQKAVASGLTHTLVSVYGPTPRTHQAITRTPESFVQTINGIRELLRYPQITLMTNSVITKKNYRYLPQMVEMLAGLGVKNVNLSFVQIIGNAMKYQKHLVPRVNEVLPHLRAAVDLGVDMGLNMGIGGLPYCVLKGYEHHFGVDDLTYIENSHQSGDNITERSPYTKAKACRQCALNAVCLGMQEEYLNQYGEAELDPYHGRRQERRPDTDIVRAMFPDMQRTAAGHPSSILSQRTVSIANLGER